MLSGQSGFLDFNLSGGRIFVSLYSGMEEVLVYFSHPLLRKSSRLICGGGIFIKTDSQGSRLDFSISEIILIDKIELYVYFRYMTIV
jgi:hypothetical protein